MPGCGEGPALGGPLPEKQPLPLVWGAAQEVLGMELQDGAPVLIIPSLNVRICKMGQLVFLV